MSYKDRILRISALALLLYSLVNLGREYRLLCETEELARQLSETRRALTLQREELALRLEQPPDGEELRRLAWERLGMVAPDETVFYFLPSDEDKADREDSLWHWKLEALWKDG